MDCRTCEPTLIDLVHSELATDAAREAHAHLATCASCRASFETLMAATRLAAQLPMIEPPAHVAPRVMELAQAHAREAVARQRVVAPRPTPWQALLDFVGRMATLPQVAMATVMVLIVSVGLWSLPRLRQEAPSSAVVVNPEPAEGEVAATTGVEPAEPLDLKVDMRAGRIRSKDGLPLQQPAAEPPPPEQNAVPAEALAKNERSSDDPFEALNDVDLGESARQAGAGRDKEAALGEKGLGGGLARSDREFAAKPASAAPQRTASSASMRSRAARPEAPTFEDELVRSGGRAEELAAAPSAPSAPAPSGRVEAKPQAVGEGAGVLEARSEPKKKAAPALAPAPKSAASEASAGPNPKDMAASSLAARLEAARSLARENGCSNALPSYQRLVAAAPTSSEAGQALLEMAQCRRNAGDVEAARKLLVRATDIPAVASRARAQLAALPGVSAPAASSEPAP